MLNTSLLTAEGSRGAAEGGRACEDERISESVGEQEKAGLIDEVCDKVLVVPKRYSGDSKSSAASTPAPSTAIGSSPTTISKVPSGEEVSQRPLRILVQGT